MLLFPSIKIKLYYFSAFVLVTKSEMVAKLLAELNFQTKNEKL